MKQEITDCLTYLANRVAETIEHFPSWSMEFCQKEIKEAYNEVVAQLKTLLDWDNLTVEECKALRFRRWSDDMPNLWLIPIWLIDAIPTGIELVCISGEKVVFNSKKDIDNDTRFGCLAYGIIVTPDIPEE